MKEKDKEELQSRREFFKKTARKALPILGAIMLMNVPMLKSQPMQDAGCTCQGACGETCNGGCFYKCNDRCYDTCKDTCSNQCTGTCVSTCKGSCSGCQGSCEDTCKGR